MPGGCGWRFLSTSAASFTRARLDSRIPRGSRARPPAQGASFTSTQPPGSVQRPSLRSRTSSTRSPLKHRAAHVDLRGRVAVLALPRSPAPPPAARRAPRPGARVDQLLQLLVALAIERILGEGEAVLRDRLHLARPLEQRCALRAVMRAARRAAPGGAGRSLLRTTSFSPDQVSSTAHTLMSTSPSGSASARMTSSVMSVLTPEACFGQLTQMRGIRAHARAQLLQQRAPSAARSRGEHVDAGRPAACGRRRHQHAGRAAVPAAAA